MLNFVTIFAAGCLESSKFGVPTWYKYLNGTVENGKCVPQVDLRNNAQEAIVAILLAVFEIVLFLAGIIAVGYIIWGGFQYMLSRGEPDRAAAARTTIINALIGLAITVASSAAVGFIGRSL